MTTHNKINEIIKEFLYIIYSETYDNKTNSTFIERYVAKHPLLKPELIVINDQIQGFKKVSKKVMSLEEFPIYLEIEGVYEASKMYAIDSIDLYSETEINCQERLTDIIYISNIFERYISFERTIDVSKPKDESIVITSKIQDYLILNSELNNTQEIDYDKISQDEDATIFINLDQFKNLFRVHLRSFVEFISICHDILIKDISLHKIKPQIEQFIEENE